ncbi:hypothetical protein ACJMK2_012047 [Sinanodonta woodiana]|uniref:Uncharacterized protein n=1 Tax=Sinanodonta woodiana TaxID=1069815 RepID=A0ABD3V6Y3_SINWO
MEGNTTLYIGVLCLGFNPFFNFANLMAGMNFPPIPPGMKLDDLRETFRNLPPAMKEQLDSMAKSYGMSIDDVEQALDNPPEQLKQMFEIIHQCINVVLFSVSKKVVPIVKKYLKFFSVIFSLQ